MMIFLVHLTSIDSEAFFRFSKNEINDVLNIALCTRNYESSTYSYVIANLPFSVDLIAAVSHIPYPRNANAVHALMIMENCIIVAAKRIL